MRSVRLLFALLLVVCFIFSLAHGETSEGSKDGEGTLAQNNSPKIQFPRRRLFRKRINAFADGGAGAGTGDGTNNVTTSVSMSQSVSSSALDSSKPETIAIKPGRPLPKFFKSDRPRIKFFKPEGSLHKYAKSERPLPKYLKTTTTTTTKATTESTTPTVTNPPQLEMLEYETESTESEPEAEPDPTPTPKPKPKPKLQFKLDKELPKASSSTPPPKFVMPKRSFLKPKLQALFPQKTKLGVVQKPETETKPEFVLSVVEKEPELIKIETTTEQPKQKPKFFKSERTFSKFVKPERKAQSSVVESVPQSETQTEPEKSRPKFLKSERNFSKFSKPGNKAQSVESVPESETQPEKSRPKFFKSQRPLPSFLLKRKLQAQTQLESESESGSQLAVEKESPSQKRFFKPSARPPFNKFTKPEPIISKNEKSDRILQTASAEHEQYHREVKIEEDPEEEYDEEEEPEAVPESTTTSKFLVPPNRRPSFIKSNNKPWMSRTPGFKSKLKSGTSTEHAEREYYATTTRKPTATTASTTILTTLKPRLNLFSRFQNRPKPPLTYNNKYSSDKSKNDIIPPVTTTIGTNTAAETPNSSFKPKARPNFGRAPTNRPIVKSTLKKLFRPTLRTTATTAYDEVIAEDEAVPENPSTTSTTPAAPTITTTPAAAAQFLDPQRTGTQSTTNTISPTPDYALNAPASQPTEMSASSSSAAAAAVSSVSGSGSGSGSASAETEAEAQSSSSVESRPSFKNKNMIIIPVPPSQRKPYHPVIMQVTKTPGVSSTEKPQTKVTTYKLNKMFVPMGIYGKVLPKSEYSAANYSEMNAGEGTGVGGLGQFTDTADLITATQGMTPVPPQKPTVNHNNLFPSSTISPSIRHKGSSEEQMSVSDSSPVPVEYTTASLRPAIPVSESDSVFAAQEWRPAFSPQQHEEEQHQQQQQKTKSKSKNSSRERQFFDASKVDLTMNYKPDIASISFTTEKTNIADISLTTTAVPDYLGSSLGQGANNRRENYKNQNSMFQMGPPIPFPKNSNRPNSLMDSIKNAAANAASSIPGLIHGGLTQLSHLSQPFEDTLFGATQANSVKSNSGNLNNPYSNGNNWNAVNNGNNGNNGNFGNNGNNGNNGNFGNNGNNGNYGNNNNGNQGNGNNQNGNQGNGNGNNGNVKGGGANGGGVTLGAPDDETLEYFRKRPHLLNKGLNNKPFQPSYSSGGFKPVTAPAHFAKAYYASTTTSSPSSHSEATYPHPSSTTTPRPSYEEPSYDSHKPSLLTRSPKNVQEWKDSYVDQLLESSNKYKYATSASPSESDIIKSHWREMSQKYTKNEIDEATNKIYSLMSSSSNPDLDELLYMKPPGQGHPGPGGLSRSSSASAFHDLLKMFRLGFSYGSVSSTSKPYETTVGALRSRESLHHAASEIESWRPIKSGREPAPFVSFNAGITFGPTPTPSSHPKPRPTPVYSGSGHGGTHYSSSSKPFIPGSSSKNPHGYLKTSGSSSLSSYFGSNLNSYIKGHHHGHRGHPGSSSSSSYHHTSPPPRYPSRPPSSPDFNDVYYGSSTLKGGENGEVVQDEDENGYKPPSNLASLYQNDPGIEIIPSSVYYKQKEQGIISSGEIAAVLKPSDMSDESVKARIPEAVSNVPQITYPSGKAPQTFQTLNQVNSYFQSSEPTSENQVHFQPPLYRLIQQSLQSQDAQLAYHQQSALQSHQHGGASQSSYKSVQPEEDSAPSYYQQQSVEQEDQSHSLQYQPPPKSHGSSHSHATVQHHHHHQPATVQHHYQPQSNEYQAEQQHQQQQHQHQQPQLQHQYAQQQQQHQYQQPQVQQQPQHYQQQHQHQQHSGVAVKATGDSGLGFSDFELPAGVDPDIAALLKAELDKDDIPEEFRKEFAEQEKKQQKSGQQQQQQHGSASSTSIAIAKAPASLVRTSTSSTSKVSKSQSISAQRREDAIKTIFHKPIPISPTLLTPAVSKSRAPVRIPATIPRYVLDLARKLKNDRDLQGIVRVTSKKEGGPPIEYLYPVRGR